MASLGGINFISLGRIKAPNPPGQQVEMIERANLDSAAYRHMGSRGTPFALRGVVDVVDAAAKKALILAARALMGTVVSYVDDDGLTWTNNIVLQAVAESRPIVGAVGGLQGTNGTIMLTVDFTVMDLNT